LLVRPVNGLIICLLAWLGFRRLGWMPLSRLFLAALLLYAGAVLLTPLPELAVRSLESRFPVPPVTAEAVAGIIVLGGAADDGAVAAARGQPLLGGAAERLTTAMALYRQMADRPLVVSGFSGRLNPRGWSEAEITTRLFEQQGLDLSRVRFEAESRNTAENARRTAALLGTDEARPWLLVTSAWHMPRAVASFRATGLSVLPYPVDFRTEPARLRWPRDPGESLGLAETALHEWLGLLAYYVAGNSEEIFPAPH
jgi:uncharacterized SAM-binding protein YcdF (DUF218 family)